MKRLLLAALAVFAPVCGQAATSSLWFPSTPPLAGTFGAGNTTHGTKMTFNVAGTVNGIKWYKPSADTTTSRTMILWNSAGTNVNSCTTSAEPTGSNAWIGCTFTTGTTVTANSVYYATYNLSSGGTGDYGTGASCGGVTGGNTNITCNTNLKAATQSTFPTISTNATDFADVVFAPSTASTCGTPNCYYLDSTTGSDSNPGTQALPWKTITQANTFSYPGASSIFFQGGETFNGCLILNDDTNMANNIPGPFIVGSYGTGNATIVSTSACASTRKAAITIDGINNVTVENLVLQGANETVATGAYSAWCHSCNPTYAPVATGGTATYATKLIFGGPGNVSALSFFKSSTDTVTTRNLILWDSSGNNKAQCTTASEAAGPAWISCSITAFTITAGATYFVSYDAPSAVGAFAVGTCSQGTTRNSAVQCTGAGFANAISTFPNLSSSNTVFADVTFNLTTAATFPVTPIGILITNNDATPISGFTITGMDISNFADNTAFEGGEVFITGLSIPNGAVGNVSNVSVTNNSLHGANGVSSPDRFGINGYGGTFFPQNITNVTYSGNTVYNLGGSASAFAIGISPAGVSGALVENNIVHDIGANSVSCGGPSGIETFNASNVTIQQNEVYNVKPVPSYGGGCDWDGYDLDGFTTNSVVQYNYSHGNRGNGYLAFVEKPWGGNVFRYNISENDGAGDSQQAPFFVTATPDKGSLQIYNNDIYQSSTAVSTFCFVGNSTAAWPAGSLIANNSCYLAPGGSGQSNFFDFPFMPTATGITFENNDYYTTGSSPIWRISGANGIYKTLSAWQTATGSDANSITTNPLFTTAGGGGTLTWTPPNGPQPGPSAYTLQSTSPLLNTGAVVASNGGKDYYGNNLPGSGITIGASQGSGSVGTPHVSTPLDGLTVGTAGNPQPAGGWNLLVDDEFNGTTLDTSLWTVSSGATEQGGTFCYDSAGVAVNNHELDLTVLTETSGACFNALYADRGSARIRSGPAANAAFNCAGNPTDTDPGGDPSGQANGFCFGPIGPGTPSQLYLEALIMNPCSSGTGQNHVGFWTNGNAVWPNGMEIDLFNTHDANGQVDQNVYSTATGANGVRAFGPTAECGYHLASALWSSVGPTYKWFVDGVNVATISGADIQTNPAQVFLESNVNGTTFLPASNVTTKVKYFHLFGKNVPYPPTNPETNYGGPGDLAGKTLGGT